MQRLGTIIFVFIVLVPIGLWGFRAFNFFEGERHAAEYNELADRNNEIVDAINGVIQSAEVKHGLIRQAIDPTNEYRNGARELLKMSDDDLSNEIVAAREKIQSVDLEDGAPADAFIESGLAVLDSYEASIESYGEILEQVDSDALSDAERSGAVEARLGALEIERGAQIALLEEARIAYFDAARP